ncbi:MAG: type II toxin-antitoxin system VapC family toxin [Steroidobacteraceae bacterium]
MRVVVDTNVLAYHLLGTPRFAAEAGALLGAADEILAPALWEAELANVVWLAARTGVLPESEAPARLSLAGRLGVQSVPIRALWQGALIRSLQSGVPIYDTLFVELADRERLALATFDRQLAKAFPAVAKRPGEVVLE